MSLQIWLPLDGDTRNLGICSAALTTSGITWDDSGKIGAKSLSGGTITIPASAASKFYNNTGMSFAFWIYPVGDSGNGIIIGQSSMAAGDNRMYSIFQYDTPNKIHLSWQSNESGSTFLGTGALEIFTANTWTHCCITYDGQTARIYKNGDLFTTTSGVSTRTSFEYAVPINGAAIRKLNDVRIYDHCLSVKEVKELARGLICGYSFNDYIVIPKSTYSIVDISGLGRNILPTTTNVGWVAKPSDDDNGYYFDGSTRIMTNGITLSGEKVVSFWVKTPGSSYPSGSTIMFVDRLSNIAAGFYSGDKIICTCASSGPVYTIGSYYKPNQWNHICIFYNSSKSPVACYINGQAASTSSNNNWSMQSTDQLSFGGRVAGSNFTGSLRDFRVYAATVAAADRQAFVNSLYKQVSIDNAGKLYCSQFIENSSNIKYKQNGTIIANSFSSKILPLQKIKTKTLNDGSSWGRIFYHYNNEGTILFDTVAEILHTETDNKFSLLYLLPYLKGTDDKYEFMITFPSTPDDPLYNRWKQTNNPCDEFVTPTSDGSGTAAGYEPIYTRWTGNYWGGLTRQNSNASSAASTYLSGSVGHNNWFYAVGATSAWNGGVPAYSVSTQKTELWIRLDTLQDINIFKQFQANNSIGAADFIEI